MKTTLRHVLYLSVLVTAILSLAVTSSSARPVPQNLGNGLDKIVENQLLQQGAIGVPAQSGMTSNSTNYVNDYKAAVANAAGKYIDRALMQIGTSKYLVDIMPDGHTDLTALRNALQARF